MTKRSSEQSCPRARGRRRRRKLVESSEERRRGSGGGRNGLAKVCRSWWRSGLGNRVSGRSNFSKKCLSAIMASSGIPARCLAQMEKRVAGNAYGRERELCAARVRQRRCVVSGGEGRCGSGGDGHSSALRRRDATEIRVSTLMACGSKLEGAGTQACRRRRRLSARLRR